MPHDDFNTAGHVNGDATTTTAAIAQNLRIAKADIDEILYLDLLVEHDPTRRMSDDTLRFLGELREAPDPRCDILKSRATRLAGIMAYTLDTHISRVIATQQGIDGQIIEDDLDDLLATDLPKPRWAIQDLLPEGLTILGGKKNVGKSMVAFNLALAVGTGRVALGSYPVEQGDVLFYALEDSRHRIRKRARQMLTGWNGQAREQDETLEALTTLKEPFGPQDLAATLDLLYETAQKRLVRLYHKGLRERPKRRQYKRSSLCARPPRVSASEREKIVSDCPKVQNVVQVAETKGAGLADKVSDNPRLSETLSKSVSLVESVNSHRFGQPDSNSKRREAGHDDLGTAG